MEGLKPDTLLVLQFLAMGLLATWLFHRLMGLPRPDPFHAVVQGLLFTIVIGFAVAIIRIIAFRMGEWFGVLGVWNKDSTTVTSFLSAVFIALICVLVSTKDGLLFAPLRRWGFTGLRSFPTEWFGAFKDAGHKKCYVTVEFKDGRRLHGFPYEWPTSPVGGHLSLMNAAWIDYDRAGDKYLFNDLDNGTSILLNTEAIVLVEFHGAQQRGNTDESKQARAESGSATRGSYIPPAESLEASQSGPTTAA